MTDRSLLDRTLPMLEVAPPPSTASPRVPASPDDDRVAEYLPETRTLPRFHVWTLGCQMNRSDSEEMAGRLLQAGCAEAAGFEDADLIVINTCAIREGAEQKVIGRQGQLAKLKEREPRSAGRADRLFGAGARPRRSSAPVSGRRRVPAPRRGAGARGPPGAGLGAGRGVRRGGRHDGRGPDGRRRRRWAVA